MILPVNTYQINYNNRITQKKSCVSQKYSSVTFCGKNVNPKQVAFISFETVPINKTGGMADVVGELAPELNKRGMDVRVIIPLLNAKDGIQKNADGKTVYKTHKGKEFVIEKIDGSDYKYSNGVLQGKGCIYKVNDSRVKFPVYVLYNPDDVSMNVTEYQGWIMDQVKNQEGFCKASLEALKNLEKTEGFNPKFVMSYEWTTAPIIEAMSKDPYFSETKKIENINNFGSVYQGRVGAPVAAPYLLSENELREHVSEPRVRELLKEINTAVNARAGLGRDLSIEEEINNNDYRAAYMKVAQNYEKYIPYTTNHLGFMDDLVMDSFPKKGWFKGYYNFFVPAVRNADMITGCSDTYLKELQQADRYSDGVANLMNLMKLKTHGITIGLDYNLYNPAASEKETTKPIKYPFSIDKAELDSNPELLNYKYGKQKNKEFLQELLGKQNEELNKEVGAKQYGYLEKNPNALLSTFITRFDPQQKGVDIAIRASQKLLSQEKDAQIILAGPDFNKDNELIKEYLNNVVNKFPGRAVLCDGFINNIAQFYAGSDTVLIPSRFAPFELVQLQGMRMGAVPIVANSGGLAEIIVDEKDGKDNEILGFKTKESLLLSENAEQDYSDTIRRAVKIHNENPQRWDLMLQNCLKYKRSWDKPAEAYINTIFNPEYYSNIDDLYSVDERLAAGSITPVEGEKLEEDIKFLKNKGITKIIQIDSFNSAIEQSAKKSGIKYQTVNLKDEPKEETVYPILKEICENEGTVFINEQRGKNNKSIVTSMYLAFTSTLAIDAIINNIWKDRGIDFYDVIWSDKNNIKHLMRKLSVLGYKYSHDFSKLSFEDFKASGELRIKSIKERCSELISKYKELKYLKEAVCAGKYYLK